MPYPAGHRAKVKKNIIESARKLFNRYGFESVSLQEIMAGAGLTPGGFYSYFGSKGELYSLAVGSLLPPIRSEESAVVDTAQQTIRAYLSGERTRDDEDCCPLLSLPNAGTPDDDPVKRVFERVFTGMVQLFEQHLERRHHADREHALVMSSLCIGALAIARALNSSHLACEVRQAALLQALELGGWRTAGGAVHVRSPPGGSGDTQLPHLGRDLCAGNADGALSLSE